MFLFSLVSVFFSFVGMLFSWSSTLEYNTIWWVSTYWTWMLILIETIRMDNPLSLLFSPLDHLCACHAHVTLLLAAYKTHAPNNFRWSSLGDETSRFDSHSCHAISNQNSPEFTGLWVFNLVQLKCINHGTDFLSFERHTNYVMINHFRYSTKKVVGKPIKTAIIFEIELKEFG